MTDALAPLATKLANFIRLLSSDKEGELIATAHAIRRTLKAAGSDIHALAEPTFSTSTGRRTGTRWRCTATSAAICCAATNRLSSPTWPRKRSGGNRPKSRPSG